MASRISICAAALSLGLASGGARAQVEAPAPPHTAAGGAASSDAAVSSGTPAGGAVAAAKHGVVRLERAGQVQGLGVVLRSDGRILTALSALDDGNFLRARFADGAVLPVKVVETDRAWDLALLATQGAHWVEGLRPSAREISPQTRDLYRYRARGAALAASPASLTERRELLGRDGAILQDALVFGERWGAAELGGPLLDAAGEVVALAIQACAPEVSGSCRLGAFGAPVAALKTFLKGVPRRPPPAATWLGVHGVAAHEGSVAGVRLIAVEPESPAARAGLRAAGAASAGADLIVAVEGIPVTTPDEMNETVQRLTLSAPPSERSGPGAAVANGSSGQPADAQAKLDAGAARQLRLLVFGAGKFREVAVTLPELRAVPSNKPASEVPSSAPGAPAPSSPSAPSAPSGALRVPAAADRTQRFAAWAGAPSSELTDPTLLVKTGY